MMKGLKMDGFSSSVTLDDVDGFSSSVTLDDVDGFSSSVTLAHRRLQEREGADGRCDTMCDDVTLCVMM
jgi:hypothetical protein